MRLTIGTTILAQSLLTTTRCHQENRRFKRRVLERTLNQAVLPQQRLQDVMLNHDFFPTSDRAYRQESTEKEERKADTKTDQGGESSGEGILKNDNDHKHESKNHPAQTRKLRENPKIYYPKKMDNEHGKSLYNHPAHSLVECDPHSSYVDDADIGILACGGHGYNENFYNCVESADSSLGGFCHRREGKTAPEARRSLAYPYDYTGSYCSRFNEVKYYYEMDYEECACTEFPENPQNGEFHCTGGKSYCEGQLTSGTEKLSDSSSYYSSGNRFGCMCGSISFYQVAVIDNQQMEKRCVSVTDPENLQICYAYYSAVANYGYFKDVGGLLSCSVEINGVKCQECLVGENNEVTMDCTNTAIAKYLGDIADDSSALLDSLASKVCTDGSTPTAESKSSTFTNNLIPFLFATLIGTISFIYM